MRFDASAGPALRDLRGAHERGEGRRGHRGEVEGLRRRVPRRGRADDDATSEDARGLGTSECNCINASLQQV